MKKPTDAVPMVVALEYNGQQAPLVTAKGAGLVAEQILQLANEHDIPIISNPAVTQLLSQVELGEEIPRQLYVAVAEILSFAYMLCGKMPANYEQGERGNLIRTVNPPT